MSNSYQLEHVGGTTGKENKGYSTDEDTKDINVTVVEDGLPNGGTADEEDYGLDRLSKIQRAVYGVLSKHNKLIYRAVLLILVCLYFAYFGYAMYYKFGDEGSYRLLGYTVFGVFLAGLMFILKITKGTRRAIWRKHMKPVVVSHSFKRIARISSILLKVAVAIFLIVFIIVDVAIDTPRNLIAVAGQAIFILLFFIFSVSPAKVNWHTVFWGFALQYILALIILRQEWGFKIFEWFGDRVDEFLNYVDDGVIFMFGPGFGEHFFAFKVLSIVIFFYAFISVMFYLGIMQAIIKVLGRALAFCMGTTPAESLNAAGNIFVGMTEAPLMIKPFLKDMTKSEIHAVMTGGFATIAGSVLGAYISFGVEPNHLISASVMSAPAALAISKLAYPETEKSRGSSKDFYKLEKTKESNLVEAASAGATSSVKLVGAIAANVIAFLSLLKLVNASLTFFGERVGLEEDLTLQFICSYVLYPISYFMGADPVDCRKIASLIGVKTFTNEFIAYREMSFIIANKKTFDNYTSFFGSNATWYHQRDNIVLNITGEVLNNGVMFYKKSEVIATYALCGFSNFGSMGILLGGLGALAPTRKTDFSKIVVRAMVSGTTACFLTACIAGLFYEEF